MIVGHENGLERASGVDYIDYSDTSLYILAMLVEPKKKAFSEIHLS
jgi:hypothetical protein